VPKIAKRYLKQTVKLLIGKPGFFEDNMMRLNFNELLDNVYSKTGLFFDLAHIESVNASGFGCYALKGAKKISVMTPGYTEDGGHLNSQGRKKVAEQLLIILADIAGRS
jgi:lysophospholipase L1-like esterase